MQLLRSLWILFDFLEDYRVCQCPSGCSKSKTSLWCSRMQRFWRASEVAEQGTAGQEAARKEHPSGQEGGKQDGAARQEEISALKEQAERSEVAEAEAEAEAAVAQEAAAKAGFLGLDFLISLGPHLTHFARKWIYIGEDKLQKGFIYADRQDILSGRSACRNWRGLIFTLAVCCGTCKHAEHIIIYRYLQQACTSPRPRWT